MAKKKYIVTFERGVVFEVEVLAEDEVEAKKLAWDKADGIKLSDIPWVSMEERAEDKFLEVQKKD